jgi:defect-in-organelle-trafficking protein DotD
VKKSWALSGAALCVFSLSGCAVPPVAPPPKPDAILQSLSESAQRVVIAQNDLARMSAAKNPAMIPLGPPTGVQLPADLLRPVYFHWNGPIEPAVRSLALLINYQVKTVGVAPGDPVLVNIETDRRSVYDLVQDIGLQAGNSAGVILNPASKTMTIVWGSQTKSVDGLTVGTSW